jgi:hypothetical protein
MTTITLEIPDELAVRLDPLRERLPELLSHVLALTPPEAKLNASGTALTHPVFLEMIDFLAARPTAEQIIAHKAAPAIQKRLEELLDKNREADLNPSEKEEMDAYLLVNHMMILLKARARQALSSPQ